MGAAMGRTKRNRRQSSNMHLWVLTLCVLACLAVAAVPRAEDRSSPEEDAVILMRAVYSHVMGLPDVVEEGLPQPR